MAPTAAAQALLERSVDTSFACGQPFDSGTEND